MSLSSATLVCFAGIAGLIYLDRDRSARVSNAIWLPVSWLWIVGSRPVSAWLGMSSTSQSFESQVDGSPLDALIFALLLAGGLYVLNKRKNRTSALLRANLPIVIYFAYCLISILWAPLSGIAAKRWIKAIGDLVMVLVIVTEMDPAAALRRLFARVGFLLLPVSVLLIRYSDWGRGYDPAGIPMNIGVATNKNSLGLIAFLLSLGALWSFFHIFRENRSHNRTRTRRLVAHGVLFAFGAAVLSMAHSATSVACLILGSVLVLATQLPLIKRNPAAVHALVVVLLLSGVLAMAFGGEKGVVGALGRDTTFTGRTEIWRAVIPLCPNPIIGAGFENFWIGPSHDNLVHNLTNWWNVANLNEAHDGYVEVYLNLGLVGVALILVILITSYQSAAASFRRDPETGALMLAIVATATIYNVTEAGFRLLTPIWIFLLLAGTLSRGTVRGLIGISSPRKTRMVDAPKTGLPIAAGAVGNSRLRKADVLYRL